MNYDDTQEISGGKSMPFQLNTAEMESFIRLLDDVKDNLAYVRRKSYEVEYILFNDFTGLAYSITELAEENTKLAGRIAENISMIASDSRKIIEYAEEAELNALAQFDKEAAIKEQIERLKQQLGSAVSTFGKKIGSAVEERIQEEKKAQEASNTRVTTNYEYEKLKFPFGRYKTKITVTTTTTDPETNRVTTVEEITVYELKHVKKNTKGEIISGDVVSERIIKNTYEHTKGENFIEIAKGGNPENEIVYNQEMYTNHYDDKKFIKGELNDPGSDESIDNYVGKVGSIVSWEQTLETDRYILEKGDLGVSFEAGKYGDASILGGKLLDFKSQSYRNVDAEDLPFITNEQYLNCKNITKAGAKIEPVSGYLFQYENEDNGITTVGEVASGAQFGKVDDEWKFGYHLLDTKLFNYKNGETSITVGEVELDVDVTDLAGGTVEPDITIVEFESEYGSIKADTELFKKGFISKTAESIKPELTLENGVEEAVHLLNEEQEIGPFTFKINKIYQQVMASD